MSKEGQIKAFEAFCLAIEADRKKDPDGCYFEELLQHRQLIIRNIKDDIMPFVGVYITQEEANGSQKRLEDMLKRRIETVAAERDKELEVKKQLAAHLAEAKKYDVRELNKRKKEVDEKQEQLKAEAEEIEKKLMENL